MRPGKYITKMTAIGSFDVQLIAQMMHPVYAQIARAVSRDFAACIPRCALSARRIIKAAAKYNDERLCWHVCTDRADYPAQFLPTAIYYGARYDRDNIWRRAHEAFRDSPLGDPFMMVGNQQLALGAACAGNEDLCLTARSAMGGDSEVSSTLMTITIKGGNTHLRDILSANFPASCDLKLVEKAARESCVKILLDTIAYFDHRNPILGQPHEYSVVRAIIRGLKARRRPIDSMLITAIRDLFVQHYGFTNREFWGVFVSYLDNIECAFASSEAIVAMNVALEGVDSESAVAIKEARDFEAKKMPS